MNDDRPKLLGVFPSQFPGWIPPGEVGEDGMYQPPGRGISMSVRFSPVGVSAIDVNGQLWVLVRDLAVQDGREGHRWVRFPVEFLLP